MTSVQVGLSLIDYFDRRVCCLDKYISIPCIRKHQIVLSNVWRGEWRSWGVVHETCVVCRHDARSCLPTVCVLGCGQLLYVTLLDMGTTSVPNGVCVYITTLSSVLWM